MVDKTPPRGRLGRAWFGGSTRTLVLLSFAAGLILGNGLAVLMVVAHQPAYVAATYFYSALLGVPFFSLIAWLLFVDTRTIGGANDPSEDSIEQAWAKEAGYQAFLATMVGCVAATLVFTITEIVVSTTTVLWAVVLLGAAVYGIHYFRFKNGAS